MVCIGIIGAMDKEIEALIHEMKDKEEKTMAGMTFHRGTLWERDVVVVKCGVCKVNMAVCTQLMIDLYEVDMLINTGVAGSLRPEIRIGDMVISSDAMQHDVDSTGSGYKPGEIPFMERSVFKADPELVAMARDACRIINPEIGCHVGRVVTGDQFICDSARKADIVKKFDACCVEMEGGAMAQVAMLNKVPFVIIRAISDQADDSAFVSYEEFVDQAVVHTLKLLAAMFIKMGQ